MTKPMNTAAIAEATGRSWPDWVTHLDAAGARDLEHKQIVTHVIGELETRVDRSHGWWAQGIAIAYEQHIGQRVPGQGTDGEFRVGASKTYPGEIAAAARAWSAVVDGLSEVGGVPFDGEPTISETPKRHYWRVRLADGSRVAVAFEDGASGKSRISVEHTRLSGPDVIDQWKPVWKELLARATA